MSSHVIDLTAERREVQFPHGIPVKLTDHHEVVFPAELPAAALDPILSDELDLVGLLADVINSSDGDAGIKEVVNALFRRPSLPRKFLEAIRETYAILLEDQHQEFLNAKPSVPDYVRLTTGLARVYGVELGKLFRSADSSESDSQTSKPTSPATTESTPDASGFVPDNPDSSDSAG
ncbi:hypothetical protein [Streptomyces lanatus]|uniref:Tail assembly chaperone n=1 Tax=Streptomyces lanatus TaxID=66900 RepID=A0ABV1Y054_9ACTN|nr:hypothetical protein [Streptomyces lanatus]GHH21995.1 hypothetical protein GCM10018780_69930 [Streptomyces lanatus]